MSERVLSMRRAFDEAFARPPAPPAPPREELLAVVAGGARCALRTVELAGLEPAGRVMPLPGAAPSLAGLASVRGLLVPVYRLSFFLERPGGAPGRWLVLARADEPIALGLDDVEGYLAVPGAELRPATEGHARAVAPTGGRLLPVLSVPSILGAIGAERAGLPR